ncbi:MAG: hypothetical protein RLZZ387_4969 [Chloroflexota bacterium]|jgi:hypothetical protein
MGQSQYSTLLDVLAAILAIVRLHGGSVRAERRPERGTGRRSGVVRTAAGGRSCGIAHPHVALCAGQRVLDVASGNGNATLAAGPT